MKITFMKRIARIVIILLYLLAMVASVLIILKPGAAIFQYLVILPLENCTPDDGYVFNCEVNLPEMIFPANKVVIYENSERMIKSSRYYVTHHGEGSYTAELTKEGKYIILLAPAGQSDQSSGRNTYRVYFGILFFQPTMGIIYLTLLLIGVLRYSQFVFYEVKKSTKRQITPRYFEIERFFICQKNAASDTLASIRSFVASNYHNYFMIWKKIIIDTGLVICGMFFLEWLFLVTGSSFMDKLNIGQRIEIVLLSFLALVIIELAFLFVLMLLSFILRIVRLPELPVLIAEILPAVLLSATIVLVVDNFTYVLFHFGILTSSGPLRAIYGILIGIVFLYIYVKRLGNWSSKWRNRTRSVSNHWLTGFLLGLGGIALVIAVLQFKPRNSETVTINQTTTKTQNYPNILLIGTDGLSANHMSLYGYQRETTPNIDRLANFSMVAENAFTNSGNTTGSIASILTSKWPTQIGVLFPPNILKGEDALEHLPGLLSRAGYTTVQIGVPHFVDAITLNIQVGFDIVNESPTYNDLLIQTMRDNGYDGSAYFIYSIEAKIASRVLQAFYIDVVQNPFAIVTQPSSESDDQEKIDQIITLLRNSEKPLFIHAHLMGTHGPTFSVEESEFSRGEDQTDWWMTDFYDDAILSFDRKIGAVVDYLQEIGKYNNTIIVIYSDHSEAWETRERIPMIFHFPEDRYVGRIITNTQNLDIAPTIINYLDWRMPEWMNGQSLIGIGPDRRRIIYSTRLEKGDLDITETLLDVNDLRPPFYQFRFIDVIVSNYWYEVDLRTNALESGIIEGHSDPCEDNELPSREDIMFYISNFLEKQGYDVSSLR